MNVAYVQFSVKDYVKHGVLCDEIISSLSEGAPLLSVGIGDGNYERHLLTTEKVPLNSIHGLDLVERPCGLISTFYSLDALDSWHDVPNIYKYLLFGQMIGVSAPIRSDKQSMLLHIVDFVLKAKQVLVTNGSVVIYDITIPSRFPGSTSLYESLWTKVAKVVGGAIKRRDDNWYVVEISFASEDF